MAKNYHLHLRGFVGYWDFSSDMVSYILDQNKDSEVRVLINSTGGYTEEGMAISGLFRVHGNVSVHFIGLNASAATIASMGAKHISMDADALYLVHKCKNYVYGGTMTSDELDEHISKLEEIKDNAETVDRTIASMYARRCRKSTDELIKLMECDKWITAQEALDWGFIDEVTNLDEDKNQAPTAEMVSAVGLPPLPSVQSQSIISKFIKWIESNFSQPTTKNLTQMNLEDFKSVSAILGDDRPVTSESGLTLSVSQMKKIDDAISANIASIDSLNQEIETLKQQPAPSGKQVITDGSNTDSVSTDFADVYKNANEMLNLIL